MVAKSSLPRTESGTLKTVLICHEEDPINRTGMARWLASFTDLAGIISIQEPPARMRKRIQREILRVGWLRFLDVLLFRLYYRLFLSARDRQWKREIVQAMERTYPPVPNSCEVLLTPSPNSPEAAQLLARLQPDMILARCKTLLEKRIFHLAKTATLVMHPGVCPEYRNAHGCFWALALRDLNRVGMTLLKIDEGIDTGPVYGHYSYPFDEQHESHIVIQERVVLENLPSLAAKIREIGEGRAVPLDLSGRDSAERGQPWMTAYWSWKQAARKQSR